MKEITTQKKLLLISVLFGLMVIIAFSGCTEKIFQPQDPADLRSCDENSDCIIVQGKDCCQCPTSINTKYAEYYEKRPYDNCENILCALCPNVKSITAACKEKICGQDINYQTMFNN